MNYSSKSASYWGYLVEDFATWARRTSYEVDADGEPLARPPPSSTPSRPSSSSRQIYHTDVDKDELSDPHEDPIDDAGTICRLSTS
ncbi:unnamed protein product [Penicillium viridicatum]